MNETAPHDSGPSQDVLTAVRNSIKLFASLFATWGIALGIRILLPRFLGAERYGEVISAERFTETAFIVLFLGVDVYIRQKVSVNPAHASDFFGSVMALRVALTVALFGAITLIMNHFDDSAEVRTLTYTFAAAQFFIASKESLAALLHSKGTVNELSVNNVVGKLMWGGGVVASIALGPSVIGIAASLMVAKAYESAVCWWLCRKHLGLRMLPLKWEPLKVVILSSLPYYLNTVFHTVYNKLDVYIIDKKLSVEESGLYGAASQLTGVAMLIAPMIGWVVMPLFARARVQGEEEYFRVARRTLELVLTAAIPVSLALGVGAEVWISIVSGDKFADAALALKILAPIYAVIYVSIISATILIMAERPWWVMSISLGGMLLNPLLNVLIVEWSFARWGRGGGGAGAALVQFITELFVALAMFVVIGRKAFDLRSVTMLAKSLLACGVIVGVDNGLRGVDSLPGIVRVILDGLLYFALVIVTGALKPRELLDFARAAFKQKREAKNA